MAPAVQSVWTISSDSTQSPTKAEQSRGAESSPWPCWPRCFGWKAGKQLALRAGSALLAAVWHGQHTICVSRSTKYLLVFSVFFLLCVFEVASFNSVWLKDEELPYFWCLGRGAVGDMSRKKTRHWGPGVCTITCLSAGLCAFSCTAVQRGVLFQAAVWSFLNPVIIEWCKAVVTGPSCWALTGVVHINAVFIDRIH